MGHIDENAVVRFELDEIAASVGGSVVPADVEGGIDGAAIDSRSILPGQLFVAVRAERDGHDFIGEAASAGATAALVDSEFPGVSPPSTIPLIVTVDVPEALAQLGRAARARLDCPVVGITGSVGKTTTKDLLAAIYRTRGEVAASLRSFNNELGVPLTLLCASENAGAAVIEMGARGIGHIASLCSVARPTIAIVTTVAAAHLEMFGSLDAIAEAKGELVEALPNDGLAVLNAEVPRVSAMASRTSSRVLTFGTHGDVRAQSVRLDDELRAEFILASPWGEAAVRLGVRGEHNVANGLAAAAAALGSGVPLDLVVEGLATDELSPWRMEFVRSEQGGIVLNDAYNANPESMVAALRSLASVTATRRVAVLGPMAELGEASDAHHHDVAVLARELGIEIVAVGTDAYGATPVPASGVPDVIGEVGPDTAVLVKASRVGGLEVVASALSGRRLQ